jgi:hypothetical protein
VYVVVAVGSIVIEATFPAPFDHERVPEHPKTAKIDDSPEQISGLLFVIVRIGIGLIEVETTTELSDVQPLIVQATLNDFVPISETTIVLPESPPVQFKAPPTQAEADNVRLVPSQTVVLDGAVMIGLTGLALICTALTNELSEVHPFTVQATLYANEPTLETKIDAPVKPPDHPKIPLAQALADKVIVCGWQTVTAEPEIVGFTGFDFIVIV